MPVIRYAIEKEIEECGKMCIIENRILIDSNITKGDYLWDINVQEFGILRRNFKLMLPKKF